MSNSVTLATNKPAEVRLSLDGSLLYSADSDGFLRVYETATGNPIHSWDVGQNLGGLDISPDGSFLVVADRNLSAVYRVDTSTGDSTTFLYSTGAYEGLLFDVAVLSNGTALFTQNFSGSGFSASKILDLATGTFTVGPNVNQSSVLTRSPAGDHVLVGEENSSGGPLDVYETGTGIVAQAGAGGYNWGIQAFSGALAANYVYNEGIHVYDSALHGVVTLTAWNNGAVSDLAFSPDGQWLYVLNNVTDSIITVSTADWDVKNTVPVGADVGTWLGQVGASNGSRLIVDPQSRYFSVTTDHGLILVGNPDAPVINGSPASDVLTGALFSDTLTGGGGNDTLSGGAGADTLTGGTGNDVFRDTAAGLSGDTITDFSVGDRIVITDANLAGFTFNLTGNTLTFSGGSLTLSTVPQGHIVAQVAAGGGVQLLVDQSLAQNDFNGDGISDLLWRSDAGVIGTWLGRSDGGFTNGSSWTAVDPHWHVAGTADFNGDGRVDIIWTHDAGYFSEWLGQADGSFASNNAIAGATVAAGWQVAGTGDFNNDGHADILWTSSAGVVGTWLGRADGGFDNGNNWSSFDAAAGWQVAGTGDFNGDGLDDVLWRNGSSVAVWLGQGNGTFVNSASSFASVGSTWHVAGTGDFNGDGISDVLWWNDSGIVGTWLGGKNGSFTDGHDWTQVDPSWHVAGVGDFNHDGADDIAWRNDSGLFSEWLNRGDATFVSNHAIAAASEPTNWHIEAAPNHFL